MNTYSTCLGKFCATYSNWEEILSGEPYFLRIKRENGFVIFNYSQIESDFHNHIVREARGIIFKEGEWTYPVCHAFDKFGNYGESYTPDMDWDSVVVSEKIDGSIMKLWYHEGVWHISTNSNIYAGHSEVPDIRRNNFGELFWEAVHKYLPNDEDIADWLDSLDSEYTYIFELVSPYTRVIIPYEVTDLYFLGARNNVSNYQWGCDERSAGILHTDIFPRPKLYPMKTLSQIVTASKELPWDDEGFVCYDKNFNRCKIKSPSYVMAHFARNNNVITRKHIIGIILKGEVEEFLTYASDYRHDVLSTNDLMDRYVQLMDSAGMIARGLRKLERRRAADAIKYFHKIVQDIMFLNLDRDISGSEYVKGWDVYRWNRALDNYINFTGGNKDEVQRMHELLQGMVQGQA